MFHGDDKSSLVYEKFVERQLRLQFRRGSHRSLEGPHAAAAAGCRPLRYCKVGGRGGLQVLCSPLTQTTVVRIPAQRMHVELGIFSRVSIP